MTAYNNNRPATDAEIEALNTISWVKKGNYYTKTFVCPECNHRQEVAIKKITALTNTVRILCECGDPSHTGQPKDETGCGFFADNCTGPN